MGQDAPKPENLWSTIHGLSIYARVFRGGPASAPAMVLVHGLGVSGRYLLPTAVRLASDFPTYVPDLPGFGRSAKPSRILDLPELVDFLAAWMRGQGLSRACLVGNSLGCQYIVDLGVRYPDLVGWAVLVGPTMDPQARTLRGQIGRGALDLLGEPWHYWPLLTWDYLRAGPIRTLNTLRYALKDPLVEKLARLDVPTLVVRGSRDPIAPQRWVEEMVRLLPRGKLLVLPKATHAANYTAPAALAQAVRDFLDANSSPAPPRPQSVSL
ncbi:MAG: alpha/beta hydrolase [Planctomycetes bacterium]|nr:alpha/beta hydrolase [Planctomycetota bacterium]